MAEGHLGIGELAVPGRPVRDGLTAGRVGTFEIGERLAVGLRMQVGTAVRQRFVAE